MTARKPAPRPTFFRTENDLRRWLEKYHATRDVLWVGYYKKATGKPSISWEESRDQALCFGWIDGIRKSVNDKSFMVRFTPRRPGSIWSAVNIGRVKELTKRGLMTRSGREAFERRDPARSQRYSFEQATVSFTAAQVREFRRNRKAWAFFQAQPLSYRKRSTWWVIDAKRPETRERRLRTLIRDSSAGLRIAQLRRAGPQRRS